VGGVGAVNARKLVPRLPINHLAQLLAQSRLHLSQNVRALFFLGRTWGEGPSDWLHCLVSTTRMMPSKKTVRLGQQGKAVGARMPDGFAV